MAHPTYTNKAGVVVPSVTRIIKNNLGWDKEYLLSWYRSMAQRGQDPIKFRDKAGYFGTLLHAMVETNRKSPKLDQEVKDNVTDADRQEAYRILLKYREWAKFRKLEIVDSELQLVSEEYQFGGTVDRLARINGEKAVSLIDFKTSKSVKVEHFIQTAAYARLVEECTGIPVARVLILHMPRGCKYPAAYPREDVTEEWGVFRHLLALEQAKERMSWPTQ